LSVEVPAQQAAAVVASDDVRVVLVQPRTDEAYADADNAGSDGP
jgi:hypothetical protein